MVDSNITTLYLLFNGFAYLFAQLYFSHLDQVMIHQLICCKCACIVQKVINLNVNIYILAVNLLYATCELFIIFSYFPCTSYLQIYSSVEFCCRRLHKYRTITASLLNSHILQVFIKPWNFLFYSLELFLTRGILALHS